MSQYSKENAEEIVHDIVKYGKIILTNHAKDRMKERNYQISDVCYILRTGEVVNIEQSEEGQFKCKVQGKDLEGEPGAVVTAIVSKQELVVITVLGGV